MATKYAYTSTPTWNELNTTYVDVKYRSQPVSKSSAKRAAMLGFALQILAFDA